MNSSCPNFHATPAATVLAENAATRQGTVKLPNPVPRSLQDRGVAPRRVRGGHYSVGLLCLRIHHEHIWLVRQLFFASPCNFFPPSIVPGTFPKGPNKAVSILVSG